MTIDRKTHVVGIGSSAGGLEALTQFVNGLPQDLGCVYVVAQHMSPTHRSMMAEILSRETQLKVKELVDGEVPTKDIVYIIPPASNMIFKAGRFSLTLASPEIAPKPSVNLLFQSIAEEFEERAVGIILSGTGSDGTSGLRAIKTAGGITFVQSPETAKYDGMPRSAIDACVADRIVSPDQIGRELERLLRFPGVIQEVDGGEQRSMELDDLFERVRKHTKIDFSSYKLSTVQRRLQRRMVATDSPTLADYISKADRHPEELDALARETLISVTEFFRDKDAFRTLKRVGRDLVERKTDGEEIRIWVAGCATGEEAYSLAVLFMELISDAKLGCRVHVFATDIDNNALAVARRGIYNQAAMAEMPTEYISRYFLPCGNGYEPTKELRECVTFARQDITTDPPFLRVDLVTCRNVLIYFNADLQAKVLQILRFALREDGLLFLGRSENVSQQEAMFSMVDRRARIFRPRGQSRPASLGRVVRAQLGIPAPLMRAPDKPYELMYLNALAEQFGPSVLVDGSFRILHNQGALSPFIRIPSGRPEMNLAQLIIPEFANEVLTTIRRVQRHHISAFSRKRRIPSLGQTWRLAIHPVGEPADSHVYLVVFEGPMQTEASQPAEVAPSELAAGGVADELVSTQEHLQVLMEEMAASNEEMQALNEEIQAANEELQATNEELEATNEELHATNEELLSVNEESQVKSAELVAINNDFEGVYNTIDVPIMVFDPNLCLKRANAAANRLYGLPASCEGIHVSQLNLPQFLDNIELKLANALNEQRKESFHLVDGDNSYEVFVTPTVNRIRSPQSIVLMVLDHTAMVKSQKQIRDSQERLLSIMNHSASAVSVKDTAGCYEFVNAKFEKLFGVTASSATGKTDLLLFGRDIAQRLRGQDLEVMRQEHPVETVEQFNLASGIICFDMIRFPIFDNNGVLRAVCTQATDATARHRGEEMMRLAATVFDRVEEAIVITDPDANILTINEAFRRITGFGDEDVVGKNPSILKSGRHSAEFYKAMWKTLKVHGRWQGQIINRRKNGEEYSELLTISTVRNDGGVVTNYVGVFSEILQMAVPASAS